MFFRDLNLHDIGADPHKALAATVHAHDCLSGGDERGTLFDPLNTIPATRVDDGA